MRKVLSILILLSLSAPFGAAAQDTETLADIRQQLTILNVEMQKLKRELSTTGAAAVSTGGASVLDRVNAMESELQRLTSKTEELEFRVDSIVRDGTNRIGDLEFRLVELEGGDVSTLGETTTLGGGELPAVASGTDPAQTGETQLAVGEKADFERASEALAAGDFRSAAEQFATFNQTYPGGPLAAEADLRRGQALSQLGDVREAARAYLSAFGTAPTGPHAPEALLQLGTSLGALGQLDEACVTLSEVSVRFPDDAASGQAASQRQILGCG